MGACCGEPILLFLSVPEIFVYAACLSGLTNCVVVLLVALKDRQRASIPVSTSSICQDCFLVLHDLSLPEVERPISQPQKGTPIIVSICEDTCSCGPVAGVLGSNRRRSLGSVYDTSDCLLC